MIKGMVINMKKDILSLKGIYQFLVISDYPTFCTGIITKNNHTGLTLTKFWKDNILIDFRNRKYGKQIWRTEGGRNRYISDICNRSERISFYGEYAEEIEDAAEPEVVLRQIWQFAGFLLERQFSYAAFMQKFSIYIRFLSENDACFTEEAKHFFDRAPEEKKQFDGQGNTGRAFYCGYLLTFLMFHALAGNGEGQVMLRQLRNRHDLSLEEMEKRNRKNAGEHANKPVFLTGKNTELCSMPLAARHFFGRERELFELQEMLARGGRYLVSGIGGIGKTELMRQFIHRCEEEHLVEYICVIQYENSLEDSLIKAFPEIRGADRDANFREALARIREHAGEKVLVVIDNMNCGQEELKQEELCKLPAVIFVTSRHRKLEGFETYRIETMKKEACRLVFRDNYQKLLTEEDKAALEEIINKEIWQHTLTLRLLGCVARTRSWTVRELLERLKKGEAPVSPEGQEGYAGLQQVYRRTYAVSGLKKDMNRLLKVFAALPYASYSKAFVENYLCGFLDDDIDMEESLEKLWEGGWLEKREGGYSMHPFIAECMLAKTLTEREFLPFLERVAALWEDKEGKFRIETARSIFEKWYGEWKPEEWERIQVTMVALAAAKKLMGALQERFVQLLLLAVEIEYNCSGASGERLDFLTKMRIRCRGLSEETEVYLYMLLCCYSYENVRELEKKFRKQSENTEIPNSLKCAYAAALAERYSHLGRRKQMEELTEYVWKNGTGTAIHMKACILKADIAMLRGDFNSYEEWLKRGIETGRNSGWEKSRDAEELMCNLCGCYLGLQKFEEAEKILREEESLLAGERTYFLRWKLLFYRGDLAMYRSEKGYGVQSLLEAYALAEPLFAGREDDIYADSIIELAMACNKAGRREEAKKYYEKAYAIYEQLSEHDFRKYRLLNNMSVMYLDWGKPKEALDCLTKAEPIGRKMGGLSEAELNNNLSKAYHQLKDREKELHYLREAVPVLEQFYGSEHPKVVDAKKRLV